MKILTSENMVLEAKFEKFFVSLKKSHSLRLKCLIFYIVNHSIVLSLES